MEEAIIVKYIVGEANPQESLEVVTWINASEENKKAFEELKSTWHKSAELETIYFDTEKAWTTFKAKNQESKIFSITQLVKYSAAAIVLIGLFFGIKSFTNSPSNIIANNQSDTLQKINLIDGSIIQLAHGEVSYPTKFKDSRLIELKGTAFFKVASNPNKKFTVKTTDCIIEVLGTQFEIEEKDNKVTVSVLEGKVAFTAPNGSTLLTKGESATYTKGDKGLEVVANKENKFSHITRKLTFKNDKLIDAVADIEALYGVKIKVAKEILNYPISTQFENESLENVLKVLEFTLNIKVEQKGDEILLKRKEVQIEN